MARIDNDETKGIALPFVILAHVRTGGTFCAHALSNHPQVYCDRGESVHHLSIWRKVAGMKPGRICKTLWNQTGYRASGLRLIYNQAFHKRVWPAIEDVQPHIIHLQRRSFIRQALSNAYQQRVRATAFEYYPAHSFEERIPPRQVLAIDQAIYFVQKVNRECQEGRRRMRAYHSPVLDVFYEDMVGDTPGSATQMALSVSESICAFLQVESRPLRVDLRRDFPVSTPEMFSNWPEVEAALREAGYGDDVDYELDYGERIGG